MWPRPWLLLTKVSEAELGRWTSWTGLEPGGESAFPREGASLERRRRAVKAERGSSGSPCRSHGSYRSPRAGCVEQHLGCGARGARDLRIAAHQGGSERAFDEELELRGEPLRVAYADALEQAAVPLPALLLELRGDTRGGVLRIAKLGDGIPVRAAA